MYLHLNLKNSIDSIVAGFAGAAIILLFTRHSGIGVCPDGVAYVSTSQNFASLGKCIDFTRNSLVDFPLLYPVFLGIISLLTGMQPLIYAPIINALLFGLLIFLCGSIVEQSGIRSKWIKLAILIIIVGSPCLLEVYSMMWSETIFLLFLLLFIISIRRYLLMHYLKDLIMAAIFASLASVTRYAGVTMIATGGVLLLLDQRITIKRKISHIALFTIISTSLLIINLWRNFSQSGTLTGLREKSVNNLANVAADAGSVIYSWLSFSNATDNKAPWLVYIIVLFLFFFCVYSMSKKKHSATYEIIAAVFSLIFFVFMLVSASVSRFEQMDSRLLSPVFIPLLLCAGSFVFFLYQKVDFNKRKWVVAFGVMLFVCLQWSQLNADYETWDGVKDAGIPGYTEDQWRLSRTVNFIEKDSLHFKPGYTIYSNAYDAVNFFTGRKGKFLPHKEFTDDVRKFMNDQHCYMIWFADGDNPDLVDMNFIENEKKMKLIKQFDDGAIYEYNK